MPTLEKIAADRLVTIGSQLVKRGKEEAGSLSELLERQRARIAKAAADFDPKQLNLDLLDERREREANRRHWTTRLERLEKELIEEPKRLEAAYSPEFFWVSITTEMKQVSRDAIRRPHPPRLSSIVSGLVAR